MDVNAIFDEPKTDSSSTDHQSALPSDNVQYTPSGVVNVPSSACATIKIANVISECIDSPLSLGTKLPSKTTKEAKIKPGQKIANVVKKLSQEHHVHTSNPPSTAAPKNEEMSDRLEYVKLWHLWQLLSYGPALCPTLNYLASCDVCGHNHLFILLLSKQTIILGLCS